MSLNGLFFDLVQIDNLRVLRSSTKRDSLRNVEAHDQSAHWLGRVVGKSMFHAWSQVGEVVRAQGMGLVGELQRTRALQNEIDFFLAIIDNILARPARVDRNFSEARDASERSGVLVPGSEHWLEMTSRGGQVSSRLTHVGQITMQPRGVNRPVLGRNHGRNQQQKYERPGHFDGLVRVVPARERWYITESA